MSYKEFGKELEKEDSKICNPDYSFVIFLAQHA